MDVVEEDREAPERGHDRGLHGAIGAAGGVRQHVAPQDRAGSAGTGPRPRPAWPRAKRPAGALRSTSRAARLRRAARHATITATLSSEPVYTACTAASARPAATVSRVPRSGSARARSSEQEQLERLGEQRRIERQRQPRRGDGQEADHRLCGHGPAGREADRARERVREEQREPKARNRESLDGGHRADGLRERPGQHVEGGRVGERHPLAADPARPGAGPRLVRARVERERRLLVERVHQLRVGVDVGVVERRVRERDQREDDRRRGHPGGRGAEDARKAARERAGQNAKGHDRQREPGPPPMRAP